MPARRLSSALTVCWLCIRSDCSCSVSVSSLETWRCCVVARTHNTKTETATTAVFPCVRSAQEGRNRYVITTLLRTLWAKAWHVMRCATSSCSCSSTGSTDNSAGGRPAQALSRKDASAAEDMLSGVCCCVGGEPGRQIVGPQAIFLSVRECLCASKAAAPAADAEAYASGVWVRML